MTLQTFTASWFSLALQWAQVEAQSPGAGDELLMSTLDVGIGDPGDRVETMDVGAETVLACEIALTRISGAVDEAAYVAATPGRPRPDMDPVDHFCRSGWRNTRNPSLEFDTWWYWNEYMDASDERVSPLVHFLLEGRRSGYSPRPVRRAEAPPATQPQDVEIRRVCLFAAFDVDGIVDPYVIAYVRELSRFADVYYLSASSMTSGELEKLDGLVAGSWAIPHDRYDFGSYAMLAQDLVGWEAIEQYDEMLLVNDSCYLLRTLDAVFETMRERACDWWGLQLTSRWFDGVGPGGDPMPIEQVRREAIPAAIMHPDEYPHVGSYFLAFRPPAMNDPGFRRRLERVAAQKTKLRTIYKYETGTTRYLTDQGYHFDTFVTDLYPYHPMYRAETFDLVGEGYPVFKRQFLAENPYDAPDLRDWRRRLGAIAPEADLDMIEHNLLRVAADDRLQRSFGVVAEDDGTVVNVKPWSASVFSGKDRDAPKFEHWWAFPVCPYDHTLAGNGRAVFEEVKDDPSIKKIILTRSRRTDLSGENTVVVSLMSREGQEYLTRAGQIFVKHGPTIDLPHRVDLTTHNLINLWHGIPLKRFGMASAQLDDQSRRKAILTGGGSRAVVTSSRMDSLAMSAAFFPASYPDMWPTGLPRNDFVARDEGALPPDMLADIDRLRTEMSGRRLVMFLPTLRVGREASQVVFDRSQLAWLEDWASRHDAVIGIRDDPANSDRTYSRALLPLGAIDLSVRRYPQLEVLYRLADALVSDYSSCLVDFLLTGKPVVSFARADVSGPERGMFYELDRVVPGPVCRTFDELAAALGQLFDPRTSEQLADYDWKRGIFFDHLDDQASWRVVQRVKTLYIDGA